MGKRSSMSAVAGSKANRKPGPAAGIYPWRGRDYRGMRAVARAAGVSCSAVVHHLDRYGHLERLGCGAVCNWKPERHMRRVVVGEQHWDSIKDFAAELGVHPSTASQWLRRGERDRILSLLMAAGAKARKGISA